MRCLAAMSNARNFDLMGAAGNATSRARSHTQHTHIIHGNMVRTHDERTSQKKVRILPHADEKKKLNINSNL